jgi:hypothetical protein
MLLARNDPQLLCSTPAYHLSQQYSVQSTLLLLHSLLLLLLPKEQDVGAFTFLQKRSRQFFKDSSLENILQRKCPSCISSPSSSAPIPQASPKSSDGCLSLAYVPVYSKHTNQDDIVGVV